MLLLGVSLHLLFLLFSPFLVSLFFQGKKPRPTHTLTHVTGSNALLLVRCVILLVVHTVTRSDAYTQFNAHSATHVA